MSGVGHGERTAIGRKAGARRKGRLSPLQQCCELVLFCNNNPSYAAPTALWATLDSRRDVSRLTDKESCHGWPRSRSPVGSGAALVCIDTLVQRHAHGRL